jgi:hypothetical protein
MKTNEMNLQDIQNSCNPRRESGLPGKFFVAMLVLSLGSALLLFGCERPATGGGAADKRMADMEKQIAILQEQNRDVRAKLRTVHVFGRSSLGDFFASPELWQCTYDSSWADCSGRCSKQTSAGFAACLQKPEGNERTNCINDNTARGQACLKNCPVQTSPTDPPECRGGTGPGIN